MPRPRPRQRLSHETRALWLALGAGAPAIALSVWLLWSHPYATSTRFTLLSLVGLTWLVCALTLRDRVARPLQTLSNLLAALREGDTSIRARGANTESALGLAIWETNALTERMRRQRLDALEATAMLRRVMEAIDVAVFAFDEAGRLRLVNQDGEQLLGLPAERALGREAGSLGIAEALTGDTPRLVELRLGGRSGRWEVRRGVYRQDGRPHQLVVLSDLTRSLREEERQAWLRLIRVLSHEINNSLAPIQSIAGSLRTLLERGERPETRVQDLSDGLGVIETRAQALGRFMHAYARLARLPKPAFAPVDAGEWVRRVAGLETRLRVRVVDGPAVTLQADGDQLDQLLINLVRNAVDAALETGGAVTLTWSVEPGDWLELRIEDSGPGIADPSNLFVPFFTTKPEGGGIGLALSRQIVEAHGGSVSLENRAGARGALARVRLPIRGPAADRSPTP